MKSLLITIAIVCSLTAAAQNYTVTDAGSSVKFSIKNFGLTVNGSFTGLQGKVVFDSANLAAATFEVSVSASTVNTGNGSRDKHLNKEEYFNTAAYPRLSFTSTKITAASAKGSYVMDGMITIKGTIKAVHFPFTATATASGYQFDGTFKLNRRDFKVGSGSMVLSDNLDVVLKIAANK